MSTAWLLWHHTDLSGTANLNTWLCLNPCLLILMRRNVLPHLSHHAPVYPRCPPLFLFPLISENYSTVLSLNLFCLAFYSFVINPSYHSFIHSTQSGNFKVSQALFYLYCNSLTLYIAVINLSLLHTLIWYQKHKDTEISNLKKIRECADIWSNQLFPKFGHPSA